jgi:hypothetical protein
VAQVAQTHRETDTDYLLEYLTKHWRSLADVVRQWRDGDPTDQDVFGLEWTVKEERLAQLQERAGRGELTAVQRARYDALLKLVAQSRPLLDRLLAS